MNNIENSMEMPAVNSLIEYTTDGNKWKTGELPKVERVLYFDTETQCFVLIDIFSRDSLPVLRERSELMTSIENGNARVLEKDPFDYLITPENEISEKNRLMRDEAYDSIAVIVEAAGLLPFFAKSRGNLVAQAINQTGCTKKTLYERCRRYWKSGMTKNSQLPNYKNCGSNFEWRNKDGNHKKLGRPSVLSKKEGTNKGINITPEIKRKFERGIKKYYERRGKTNLRWAYRRIIGDFFHIGYEFKNSISVPIIPSAEKIPSFDQFYYWYEKEFRNIKRENRARLGRREAEMNHRAILGDSTAMAFGPGSVYQVDATIGDTYLVSEFDRNRIIGRPVIYIIIDVFSRYIAGIAVTLEGPSWLGAMLALDNVVTDKVAFCAEHNIIITPQEWNCRNLPESILADRGEFEGYGVESLVNNLGIRVQNTPPYRADFKGIVERAFGKANEKFIHFLPGAVERTKRRGDHDYRLDAVLTLKEFRTLLITYVLNYNANNHLTWYKPDEFLISDNVELYPQDLWNWGIQNRSGHLRVLPQEIVRLNLLPRKEVSVTHAGIHFEHNLYYTCELAQNEGWFEQARQRGAWKIEVAFDPRNIDTIYLPLNNGREIIPCRLTPSAQLFKMRSLYDAQDYFASKVERKEQNRTRDLQTDAEFHAAQEKIVTEAKDKTETAQRAVGNQSNGSRLSNIRANRAEEREMERRLKAFDISVKDDEKIPPATHEVPPVEDEDDAYIPASSNIRLIKQLTGKK